MRQGYEVPQPTSFGRDIYPVLMSGIIFSCLLILFSCIISDFVLRSQLDVIIDKYIDFCVSPIFFVEIKDSVSYQSTKSVWFSKSLLKMPRRVQLHTLYSYKSTALDKLANQ